MSGFVDTHAHIQGTEFDADREDVIRRATQAGVRTIVVPAVDIGTTETALALAKNYEGTFATAGYHPHEASKLRPAALSQIEALLAEDNVVAVGEIGLDFYYEHSSRRDQIAALEAQLDLAARHALPVVIHCRDAWPELQPLLAPWAQRVAPSFGGQPLGVLHYFSGSIEDALLYHGLGFLISVHTSVTHKKADALRGVVAALPLNALVIETDSPYGAPQSARGKRNEPAYVVEAARSIAALHATTLDEVAEATSRNAGRLFRLASEREAAATGAKV